MGASVQVWINMVERKLGVTLVLEDDVDMEDDFVEIVRNAIEALPDDWALFWVGHCYEDMQEHGFRTKVGHRRALTPTRFLYLVDLPIPCRRSFWSGNCVGSTGSRCCTCCGPRCPARSPLPASTPELGQPLMFSSGRHGSLTTTSPCPFPLKCWSFDRPAPGLGPYCIGLGKSPCDEDMASSGVRTNSRPALGAAWGARRGASALTTQP